MFRMMMLKKEMILLKEEVRSEEVSIEVSIDIDEDTTNKQ